MDALQMATTTELIKELFNRHEATLIITTSKPQNGEDPHRGEIRTLYRGGTVAALGLAEIAKQTLLEHTYGQQDETEEVDEEEDDDEDP